MEIFIINFIFIGIPLILIVVLLLKIRKIKKETAIIQEEIELGRQTIELYKLLSKKLSEYEKNHKSTGQEEE